MVFLSLIGKKLFLNLVSSSWPTPHLNCPNFLRVYKEFKEETSSRWGTSPSTGRREICASLERCHVISCRTTVWVRYVMLHHSGLLSESDMSCHIIQDDCLSQVCYVTSFRTTVWVRYVMLHHSGRLSESGMSCYIMQDYCLARHVLFHHKNR